MLQELYEPLDSSAPQLRIFTLYPSDNKDSPVKCSIQTENLNSVPTFEVLSYARDRPELKRAIQINQELLFVPANVEVALQGLRRHDEPRNLWVDFICVDQRSFSERSFHVTFMKAILRQCARVLVWLGPNPASEGESSTLSEDDIGKGLRLIERISKRDASLLHLLEKEGAEYRQKRAAEESNTGFKPSNDLSPMRLLTAEQQQDFENALQIPSVWRELWIVQEICLASQVHLVAGSHVLDWSKIEDFLGDSSYSETIYARFYHGGAGEIIGHMIQMILRIHHQRRITRSVLAGEAEQSLLADMGRFRFVKTADPRDHIFSLSSLATDMDHLRVDYNETYGKVFSNLTEMLTNRDGNLNLICQSPWRSFQAPAFDVGYGYSLRATTDDKPSWAANFQHSIHGRLFIHGCPFQAGRPSCKVPCRVINGNTLVTKGVKLGRVGKIKQADYHSHTKMNWIEPGPRVMKGNQLPIEYLDLYLGRGTLTESEAKQEYVTGESSFTAFWRTLVIDCESFPTRRLTLQQIESEDNILRKEWPRRALDSEIHGSKVAREPCFSDAKINGMWNQMCFNWTFSVTDNGLYVMLVPPAQEGDIIVCLDGCQVPLVLRPAEYEGINERYKIVTVAYVHGFMDTEVIESLTLQEKLGLKEQEFWLV